MIDRAQIDDTQPRGRVGVHHPGLGAVVGKLIGLAVAERVIAHAQSSKAGERPPSSNPQFTCNRIVESTHKGKID